QPHTRSAASLATIIRSAANLSPPPSSTSPPAHTRSAASVAIIRSSASLAAAASPTPDLPPTSTSLDLPTSLPPPPAPHHTRSAASHLHLCRLKPSPTLLYSVYRSGYPLIRSEIRPSRSDHLEPAIYIFAS
ncbi:hypothetical protein LINPERHAP2_LOCUS36986, partial [Linum perenne]